MSQTQVTDITLTHQRYPFRGVCRMSRNKGLRRQSAGSVSSLSSAYGFSEDEGGEPVPSSPLSFYGFPESPIYSPSSVSFPDMLTEELEVDQENKENISLDASFSSSRSPSPTDSYSDLLIDKESVCQTYTNILRHSIELKFNAIMNLSSGLISREEDIRDLVAGLAGAGISLIPMCEGIGSGVTAVGKHLNSVRHKKKWEKISLNLSVSPLSVSELATKLSSYWVRKHQEPLVKSVLLLMLNKEDSLFVLQRLRKSADLFSNSCLEVCMKRKIPKALFESIRSHIDANYELRIGPFFVKKESKVVEDEIPVPTQFRVASIKRHFRGATVSFRL